MRRKFGNFMEVIDTLQDMFETKFEHSDFAAEHFVNRRFPKTKVIQDDNTIRLVAEIPGVKKDDLKVEFKGDAVTLSGKTSSPWGAGGKSGPREFKKSVKLPCEVDVERAEAKYENGILSVAVPISENEKSRSIEIH